jgi:tetratricopeptide (TPR) repeat protein
VPTVPGVGPAKPAMPALVEKGLKAHQAGNLKDAESIYRKAVNQHSNDANALYLLAKVIRAGNRLEESAQWMVKALARDPKMAEWHRELGDIYRQLNKLQPAIDAYRMSVALRPEWFEVWVNLGVALSVLGKMNEAEPCYRVAIGFNPKCVPALTNLGILMDRTNRVPEALAMFQQCVAAAPNMAEAHNNVGVMLEKSGKSDEAVPILREAIRLKPDYAEAFNNLAVSLEHSAKFEDALPMAARAIELNPKYAAAHNTQGSILYNLDRFEPAMASFRKSAELDPNYAEPINNLGLVQRDIGDIAGAEASHRHAISLQREYATAHFNLSYLLLLTSRLPEGWEEYEWRMRCADFPSRPGINVDVGWREPLEQTAKNGKVVLLDGEQGLGDTIQYLRFVPILTNKGVKLVVGLQPELLTLARRSNPEIHFISQGDKIPKFDVSMPVLSLGRKLALDLHNIPADVPYLKADPDQVERWRQRLEDDGPGFRVGLAWAGSPKHKRDRYRSCKLADYAPLAGTPGVRFYCLQKGPAAVQINQPPTGMTLIDHTSHLNSMDDTAAMISNLDMLITVDTSVAHLAGALGKPVLMLLPMIPDWRWLMQRSDTPWYPTMRLSRSPGLHDWSPVVKEIDVALKQAASAHHP